MFASRCPDLLVCPPRAIASTAFTPKCISACCYRRSRRSNVVHLKTQGGVPLPIPCSVHAGQEIERLCREGQLESAIEVLSMMDEQDFVPSATMYSALLKACSEKQELACTKQVHAHLTNHGFASSRFLGEFVVSTLVKCSAFEDALSVFRKLPKRSVYSWTAVISGYTNARCGEEALRMYALMREEGLEPNKFTMGTLLKACASIPDLEGGKRMHADAKKYGFHSDVFVATTLVDMYGKCGSIGDARDVFDALPEKNVVTWNAMLSAYAQHGLAHETLKLYRLMQEEGVSPSDRTMASVLQACGVLTQDEKHVFVERCNKPTAWGKGKILHAYCRQKNLDVNSFVGCALITMYGKCGSMCDAEITFSRLPSRGVVAWTAIVTAYTEQGLPEKALQLYMQMQLDGGVAADAPMFVSVFKAFGLLAAKEKPALVNGQPAKLQALRNVKASHAEAWKQSYDSGNLAGITLLKTYGRCQSIVDSQNVFDGLSQRDVVAWTAMLNVYLEQEQAENALQLYYRMQEEGVTADTWTFVTLLQACGMLAGIEEPVAHDAQNTKLTVLNMGKAIEAECWRLGYGTEIVISTALISMYGKCGGFEDAENLFRRLSDRHVAVWNALLSAYRDQGFGEKALQLYDEMLEAGVSPDERTFVSILQACCLLVGKGEDMAHRLSIEEKLLITGKAIHADICKKGFHSDVYVGSSLITMYGKCGSIEDALHVFDGLPTRDTGSWNAMLAAYVWRDEGDRALNLYERMGREGTCPNDITLICVLQACSSTGSLDVCRQIHQTLLPGGSVMCSNILGSTLIHAYGRCSSMADAQSVFEALLDPNVVSWTALLAGYARKGDYGATLRYYEDMVGRGLKPNKITFLALLLACCHAGFVDRGTTYFESMIQDYGITPQVEHYITMVDLLGRAGFFSRLKDLLLSMPLQPSLAFWLCMLGVCRLHRKVVLARQAFDRAIGLQPQHSAAYVLMWNIYADVSDWEGAKEVQEMRLLADAWKNPGKCWIEHGGKLHTFGVSTLGTEQKNEFNDLLFKFSAQRVEKKKMHNLRARCLKNFHT